MAIEAARIRRWPLCIGYHASWLPCSGRSRWRSDAVIVTTAYGHQDLLTVAEEVEAMIHDSTTSTVELNSPSSSPTAAQDICRICHCEGDNEAPLIAPCFCAGSLRYVHQACLQQWIKSSDTKSCELCKYEFAMQTKIKPLRKWEKLDMSPMERRKVLCSVAFHLVAITCVVWSLYVLIDRTAEEIQAGVFEWPLWTKLIVVAIGFTGGLVFMYVQCKMYLHLCRRWKAFNRVIYVQDAPLKTLVSAVRNGTPQGSAILPNVTILIPPTQGEIKGSEHNIISMVKPPDLIPSNAEQEGATTETARDTTISVQSVPVKSPT